MKKACIALAVLFLVSSLLTVCFGAAVGVREIRNIAEGNSRFNDWFASLEEWSEQWRARHGGHSVGETRTDFSLEADEPVLFSFDYAEVRVLPSEDGSSHMDVHYYGKDAVDVSTFPFAERQADGLHLGVRLPNRSYFSRITVDIYFSSHKIASLQAHIDAGSLTVEGMQLGKASAALNVGNIAFRNSAADEAELTADTGDLTWEDNSEVASSLSMHTDVGNIRLVWPTDAGFQLQYETDAGEFKNRFENAVPVQSGSQFVSSKGTLAFGDRSRAISLSTDTGNITLESASAEG